MHFPFNRIRKVRGTREHSETARKAALLPESQITCVMHNELWYFYFFLLLITCSFLVYFPLPLNSLLPIATNPSTKIKGCQISITHNAHESLIVQK